MAESSQNVQPKMMAFDLITDNSFYVQVVDGTVLKFTTVIHAIGKVDTPNGPEYPYKTEVTSYAMSAADFERIRPHLKPWQFVDKK